MTISPNLFNYATSELSQDAFISWLLSWADPKQKTTNEVLHRVGCSLIDKLLSLFVDDPQKQIPKEYRLIDVTPQSQKIDVLVNINKGDADECWIIIEDKTHTSEHSQQLIRYYNNTAKKIDSNRIFPIYFKTGDQCNYEDVIKDGYQVFRRGDFLSILQEGIDKVNSDIFQDYYHHLNELDTEVNSYKSCPIKEWQPNSMKWIGFCMALREQMNTGSWNIKNNPGGAFCGYDWHWEHNALKDCKAFLFLEKAKLCIKLEFATKAKDEKEKADHLIIMDKWRQTFSGACKSLGITFVPSRMKEGQYPTIIVLEKDYRRSDANELINIPQTITALKQAETNFDSIISMACKSVMGKKPLWKH